MSKLGKRVIVIFLLTFTALLLVGISIYFYKTINHTTKNESYDVDNVQTAKNLKEMVDAADVIVVGEYEGLYSTVNLARDESDASKESTELYLGGKVYRFHIEEMLKGVSDKDMIHLVHRYSGKVKIGETFGYKDEDVDKSDPTFINPSFGKTYIAFINQPEIEDFYTQSLEPYLIVVNDKGLAEVKSNIEENLELDDTISGKRLTELKQEIKALK